jgi:hypothetical protein
VRKTKSKSDTLASFEILVSLLAQVGNPMKINEAKKTRHTNFSFLSEILRVGRNICLDVYTSL